MKKVLTLICLLLSTQLFAASSPFTLKKAKDKLYFLYYDSTAKKKFISKSTVVEFGSFIGLIEMPVEDGGSDQKTRVDLKEQGDAIYAFLKAKFPKKPLKYIFSTHWHEHSIASVNAFLPKGVTLITTEKNFEYIRQMLDSNDVAKYANQIKFVQDSIVIKDKQNEVIGYRLDKTQYGSMPTKDYVFYYLPKYDLMDCSCMYYRYNGYTIDGKEFVSGRVENVGQFVSNRNLHPKYISSLFDKNEPGGMVAFDTVRSTISNGITEGDIKNRYINMDEATLYGNIDSVVSMTMRMGIGGGMINNAVYDALHRNKLHQALGIARVLCLMYPSYWGYWDTYGECYYFLGKKDLAKRYEKQCKQINEKYTGGMDVWQKDYEEFSANWK